MLIKLPPLDILEISLYIQCTLAAKNRFIILVLMHKMVVENKFFVLCRANFLSSSKIQVFIQASMSKIQGHFKDF